MRPSIFSMLQNEIDELNILCNIKDEEIAKICSKNEDLHDNLEFILSEKSIHVNELYQINTALIFEREEIKKKNKELEEEIDSLMADNEKLRFRSCPECDAINEDIFEIKQGLKDLREKIGIIHEDLYQTTGDAKFNDEDGCEEEEEDVDIGSATLPVWFLINK